MNISQAIDKQLIQEIAAFCTISQERAAKELSAAKKAAKATGLSLAESLKLSGLVA